MADLQRVRALLGTDDDEIVQRILATGASLDEIIEALAPAREPPSEHVSEVREILSAAHQRASEESLRAQSTTEVEERPYLDTEGGE